MIKRTPSGAPVRAPVAPAKPEANGAGTRDAITPEPSKAPELPKNWARTMGSLDPRAPIPGLTAELVRDIAHKLAAEVSSDTGWPIDLSKVEFEVAGADELMKMIVADTAERMGTTQEELAKLGGSKSLAEKAFARLTSWGMKKAIGGVFLPAKGKVVLAEGPAQRATSQYFRSVLYHELVHVAQHQNSPVMEQVAALGRQAADACAQHGKSSPEYLDQLDTVHARMTLLESQAMYLQEKHAKAPPADALLSIGAAGLMGSMVALLARENRNKVAQYIKGQSFMQKASPEMARDLFQNPDLVDVLFKTRGKITLKVPEEHFGQVAMQVLELRKMSDAGGSPTIELEAAPST
jgi:hypothetical protein